MTRRAERLAAAVSDHIPGMNCSCGAYGSSECGCPDTDWRSRREVAAATALDFCLSVLRRHHLTKPGIAEVIKETEMIRDAGEYRRSEPL